MLMLPPFVNREKLIVSYKFNKICPSVSSEITAPKSSEKKITLKSLNNIVAIV